MIELDSTQLNNIERSELDQYEAIIERGLQTFYEVGQALIEIRDKQLYRADYSTFESYCNERWEMSGRRAYQLIDASLVFNNVNNSSHTPPATEAHTRPLVNLQPEQQRQAWNTAVETAPAGKVTAAHVQRVVDDIRGGEATQLKREYDRLKSEQPSTLPALFNPSDSALWDATPSAKDITVKLNDFRVWLQKGFGLSVQIGKLSPEAKAFVVRKLREIGAEMFHKADELENDSE